MEAAKEAPLSGSMDNGEILSPAGTIWEMVTVSATPS
jgi:hypothetical protein